VITEKDLQEAIAECKGKRNPDSSTCIKLAAFLIIQEHLYGKPSESDTAPALPAYSYAAPPEQVETIIDYQSGTEFSEAIDGLHADEVWPIMDELMSVIQATNIRLYNGMMRKIDQL
jgi:hypothetical protein